MRAEVLVRSVLLFAIGVFCLRPIPAFADNVNFTDSTFNLANYTETAAFLSSGGDSLSFDQCSSCGHPGNALQIETFILNQNETTAIGFIGNTFTINTAVQGAITSIDASVDKNLTVSPSDIGGGNTFHPLIEQDGNIYLASISGPTVPPPGFTTGYNTISATGLQATDFLLFDFSTGTFGTAHPNFSGDPMSFGLGQIFGSGGNTNFNLEADYDNLDIGINTAAVPEPGALMLLSVGLFGLIGLTAVRRLQLN